MKINLSFPTWSGIQLITHLNYYKEPICIIQKIESTNILHETVEIKVIIWG